jgi:hypothetical protein
VLSSKDKKFEPNPSEVLRVEFNIDGRGYESSGVALIVPVAKLEPSNGKRISDDGNKKKQAWPRLRTK